MSGLVYYKNLSRRTKILNFLRKIFQVEPFEKMLTKCTCDRSTSSFFSKLIPSEYLYEPGSERLVMRNSLKYQLDISHVVDHFVYFGLRDNAFDNLLKLVRPGNIIVDIGANIGRFALPFGKAASPGVVYCFEPDSENYDRLVLNLGINKLSNVVVFKRGLGEAEGSSKLYKIDVHNPGMNRFSKYGEQDAMFETVTVSTLDREVSVLSIKKIDFIKIDVEGFEFEVLKGAGQVIDTFRPTLFVELNNENLKANDASAEEVLEWIQNKDYTVYKASDMSVVNKNDLSRQFDALCIANITP